MLAEDVATLLGLSVIWYEPLGPGRESTFFRDFDMVDDADEVIAFFNPDRVMVGGTGHVVEAALLRDTPVKAWEVTKNGLIRVGENEPASGYTASGERMSYM